jgi:hypothetical protein
MTVKIWTMVFWSVTLCNLIGGTASIFRVIEEDICNHPERTLRVYKGNRITYNIKLKL